LDSSVIQDAMQYMANILDQSTGTLPGTLPGMLPDLQQGLNNLLAVQSAMPPIDPTVMSDLLQNLQPPQILSGLTGGFGGLLGSGSGSLISTLMGTAGNTGLSAMMQGLANPINQALTSVLDSSNTGLLSGLQSAVDPMNGFQNSLSQLLSPSAASNPVLQNVLNTLTNNVSTLNTAVQSIQSDPAQIMPPIDVAPISADQMSQITNALQSQTDSMMQTAQQAMSANDAAAAADAMNKLQQMYEAISNMQKSMHDMQMQVIQNLKG
jgi:hypothetical protein